MNDATKLPPGRYLICDPCYAMSDGDYEELIRPGLDAWDGIRGTSDPAKAERLREAAHTAGTGVREIGGHVMAVFNTAYGDGLYKCHKAWKRLNDCPVDSGKISAVPEGLIDERKFTAHFGDGRAMKANIVELDAGSRCEYDDGEIRFGDITVDTN